MNDRRSAPYYHRTRQTFEDKYRALENEIKRKNDTSDLLDTSQHPNDLSRSSIEQSVGFLLDVPRGLSFSFKVHSEWFATFQWQFQLEHRGKISMS